MQLYYHLVLLNAKQSASRDEEMILCFPVGSDPPATAASACSPGAPTTPSPPALNPPESPAAPTTPAATAAQSTTCPRIKTQASPFALFLSSCELPALQ